MPGYLLGLLKVSASGNPKPVVVLLGIIALQAISEVSSVILLRRFVDHRPNNLEFAHTAGLVAATSTLALFAEYFFNKLLFHIKRSLTFNLSRHMVKIGRNLAKEATCVSPPFKLDSRMLESIASLEQILDVAFSVWRILLVFSCTYWLLSPHLPTLILPTVLASYLLLWPFVNGLACRYKSANTEHMQRTYAAWESLRENVSLLYIQTLFATGKSELKRTVRIRRSVLSAKRSISKLGVYCRSVLQLWSSVIFVWITCWLAYAYAQKSLSPGSFVTSLLLVQLMLALCASGYQMLISAWGCYPQIQLVGSLLSQPDARKQVSYSLSQRINGHIVLDDVSFSYENTPLVLKDINTSIAAGDRVLIRGTSGSGKSTLVGLLTRSYKNGKGRILIDGIDIQSYSSSSLRQRLLVIPHDDGILRGTIRDNLRFGGRVGDDALSRAAALAGLDGRLRNLDEMVDPDNMSGGQRQRIAIARAVLADPDILILDEATSALDIESEDMICRNLCDVFLGRTLIFVSHRESLAKHCNLIMSISNARVEVIRHNNALDTTKNA